MIFSYIFTQLLIKYKDYLSIIFGLALHVIVTSLCSNYNAEAHWN